jgi:hypothetical protein
MIDFPPIGDELRPKARLKRHDDSPSSDTAIDENSRRIGEKWGAATRIDREPGPLPPPAPVVSIRGYIPDYLDREMAMKAAERNVTKTFLIMEALAKAGYRVEEIDLIQDRRKRQKG